MLGCHENNSSPDRGYRGLPPSLDVARGTPRAGPRSRYPREDRRGRVWSGVSAGGPPPARRQGDLLRGGAVREQPVGGHWTVAGDRLDHPATRTGGPAAPAPRL